MSEYINIIREFSVFDELFLTTSMRQFNKPQVLMAALSSIINK